MSSGKTGSGRQPFDPRRVRGAATGGGLFGSTARGEGGGDADPATLTVSQLTRMVKAAIEKGIPADLHVIGELSNVKRSANGHLYFTMKDSSSEVRCVMWRTSARSLRFDLKDGLEVVATGSVEVYEPRGQYQLMVRRMEPRGVGALELAFSQLKERLGREGLFDAGRKRSLIAIPRTLAVVTSPTGAAIRDIIQTIRRRYPRVRVLVFGVRVQGDGAAEEIADAIRRINHECARLGGVDVMIVGRGGGSLEDLWAFNEEIVARAIFASEIPVINAVGHEIDFTIADFVADVRAATPTAAAELAVPELGTLLDDLDASGRRLRQAIRRSIDTAHSRLSIVEHSPWFRDPLGQIRRRQQWADEVSGRQTLAVSRRFGRIRSALQSLELRLAQVRPAAQLARRRESLERLAHRLRWSLRRLLLNRERRFHTLESRLLSVSIPARLDRERVVLDGLARRMETGLRREFQARWRDLASLELRLDASSPARVLRRGFTITRRVRGHEIVRGTGDVREGDRILTETADGEIASRVVDADQGELFE